jgi:SOS-response transcriptional repressor LexA
MPSKQQNDILAFYRRYIAKHRISPSFRDVMTEFNYSSIGGTSQMIGRMIRDGFLVPDKGHYRNLIPADNEFSILQTVRGTLDRMDEIEDATKRLVVSSALGLAVKALEGRVR